MKKVFQIIVCLFISMFFVQSLYAQLHAPGDVDIANAPVDGGLSLLIAGGVGYGIRKIRNKRIPEK